LGLHGLQAENDHVLVCNFRSGLGERQITEFIEDDDVEAGKIIGQPGLAARPGLGLKPVDEIDGGEEAAAGAGPDAIAGNGLWVGKRSIGSQ
jgi:hypothetical protein